MSECEHDFTLWVPMNDNTDRYRRYCQNDDCGVMETQRNELWD